MTGVISELMFEDITKPLQKAHRERTQDLFTNLKVNEL